MAVEIPVYVDVFEPLKNAAKDVPQAAKPLESQMDALSDRMSKSILKMGKAAAKSASGVDIGNIDQKMARYANSARLAAQRMAELGEAQGVLKAGSVNIASLSAQVTNLANKWNAMRLNSKFDENGKIRNRAQEIIDKLTTAAEKAIKFGDALNKSAGQGADPLKMQINLLAQYEKYMARLKEGKRVVEDLQKSMKGLMAPNEQSMFAPFDPKKMDAVLTALAHAQVQLNKPVNIEPYVEGLSRADFELLQMREHYRALEESSRRLSTSINGYRERIAELNEQWNRLTAEEKFTPGGKLTAEAQQLYETFKRETEELRKQGQTLDQMLQKEERLTEAKKRGIQTRRYENAILNTNVKTMRVLQEQERILSERLSRAQIGSGKYKQLQKDLEAVRMEIERVNGRVSSTVPELGKVDNKLANLIKRSIQLLALHSATTFIRNIREVTSEFEMQRVALGGIIQDTEKANALFKEIKAAAVRSPFEIKDLVTYTKQLSAYRVETEDLFRVTMQLADVSAGLGVDMNRLILAYGQVKSASVLRGQELRQFTEAGIPLVKLLADKFVELGRAGTTTADVFELISKRAVPFEMIAEIFDDMTQRGGMFYKMQEKQSETLLGQWNNLKDSLSIMYDEIGNTETVHGAMTSLMNDAKFLFQNWRLISEAVKAAVVQYGAMKIASMWMPNLRRELSLAKKAQDALTRSTELSKYAMESGSKSALREAARLKTYSALIKQASLETRLFHRAWLMLKAVMSGGGWIGLAVGAVTALSSALFSAYKESSRLTNELKKIGAEGETNINRSVSNFNRLAHAAVSAADGSKEQTAAVAELKRTYGDIIPVQQLEANALRELQGNYESLTRAIREKISEQIREQKVSTIVDEYGKKITKRQGKASNYLGAYGLDKEQIRAVMDALQEAVEDGLINVESTVFERSELFKKTIYDLTGVIVDFGNGFRDLSGTWRDVRDLDKAENALNDLLDVYLGLNKQIKDVDDSMSGSIGTYGKFAKMSKDMAESLSSIEIDTSTFGKKGTFKYNQENIRQRVEVYWNYIQKAFEEVNRERAQKIDISSALLGDGKIDFDFIDKAVEEAMAGGKNTRLNTFIDSIQEGYEKLIPSDRIVNLVRAKVAEFANAFNVPMDTAQQYYKKADDSLEDYVKSLQESEKSLNSSVNEMELNNKEIENGTEILRAYSQAEIDAAKNTHLLVQALIKYFSQFKKNQDEEKKEAYVQDPFIKQLQDRMKFMKDFQSGYEKLQKYMSSSAALGKESQIMLTRGMSIGIEPTEQKRAAEDLSKWYEDTYNAAFDYLKKNKGVTGTMQEFLSRQITENTNRDKMLKDFQSLIQSLFDAKTDFDTAQTAKNIEESIARVKDEIKRSETARNFYQDILDITGDEDLASSMTVSVYGGIGEDFKERMQEQLNTVLRSLSGSFEPDISTGNVEMWARPIVEAAKLAEAGWEDAGKSIGSVYTKVFEYEKDGEKHSLTVTPVLPDGSVMSPRELETYVSKILAHSDFKAADSKKIIIGVDIDDNATPALASIRSEFYGIATEMSKLLSKSTGGVSGAAASIRAALDGIGDIDIIPDDSIETLLSMSARISEIKRQASDIELGVDTSDAARKIESIREEIRSTPGLELVSDEEIDNIGRAVLKSVSEIGDVRIKVIADMDDVDNGIARILGEIKKTPATVDVVNRITTTITEKVDDSDVAEKMEKIRDLVDKFPKLSLVSSEDQEKIQSIFEELSKLKKDSSGNEFSLDTTEASEQIDGLVDQIRQIPGFGKMAVDEFMELGSALSEISKVKININTRALKSLRKDTPELSIMTDDEFQRLVDLVAILSGLRDKKVKLSVDYGEFEGVIKNIGSQLKSFSGIDASEMSRLFVDSAKLAAAGWDDVTKAYARTVEYIEQDGSKHTMLVSPVLPNGNILSPKEFEEYVSRAVSSVDYRAIAPDNIVIGVDVKDDAGAEITELQAAYSALSDKVKNMFPKLDSAIISRPFVDAAKLAASGWEDAGEDILKSLTSTFTYKDESGVERKLIVTPVLQSGEILSPDELADYVNNVILKADDKLSADEKHIVISVDADDNTEESVRKIQSGWMGIGEEIRKAIQEGDFKTIMANIDKLPTALQASLKQMAADNEKYNADYLKELYKTYQKAKTFDQRRQDIRNREAQKRTEIEANKNLSEDEKTKLTNASINKEAKDIAKVNVEELKNTYEWGKAFEDLDRVGSKTLVSLRQKIEDIIEVQKDSLDPADYKALVDMLNKIKDTQIQREPVGSFAVAARRTALIAPAVFSKQGTKGYDKAIAKIKEFNEKAKETDKIDIDHLQDEFMNSTDAVKKGANAVADYMSQWKGVIDTISDIFDLDEIPILGETVDGISSALGVVAAIIPIITVETVALSAAANSIPFVAILTAIVTTLGAIIGMIKGLINAKVERLNKKIEAQKQYVDDLERSYDRLGKAMEKAFGTDYAENYAKALENLAAKQKAYEEQARLEREKGKKADEEKIKDYSDAAKDASEKIDDMKGKLAEFFTDTDLTSAAKDFALAWIDAYKEFGSTTDAMKEKFNEMVENMVVNSLAAKLIQTILDPVFQAIDNAAAGGLTAREIGDISAMIPERMKMIDGTMMTLMNQLTAAGVNLRQQAGSFTGISRSIAGASEESITGLAAGINTQNFYMQHIDMNVALILSYLTGGTTTADASVTGEVVDPYKDQMLLYAGHLPAMDQNLAELLAEVRKVIKPRGTTATHYVATNF